MEVHVYKAKNIMRTEEVLTAIEDTSRKNFNEGSVLNLVTHWYFIISMATDMCRGLSLQR